MTIRPFIFIAALLFANHAWAEEAKPFCLRAPGGDGVYYGCGAVAVRHASTPKTICRDPNNPNRHVSPSADAVRDWERADEGAADWCPAPTPCPEGKTDCDGFIRGDEQPKQAAR